MLNDDMIMIILYYYLTNFHNCAVIYILYENLDKLRQKLRHTWTQTYPL